MPTKTILWIVTALVFGAILTITIAPSLITSIDEAAGPQDPAIH
jgi:hypothetical protein